MRILLAIGCIGCAAFALAYHRLHLGWLLSCAITCGMLAYHMLARFAAPLLLYPFFRRKYDPNSWWFASKSWEEGLYRRLRVQKWKSRALTYAPDEFSLRLHSLEEIIINMCHAEAVHELIVVLSLVSMLGMMPFGAPAAFISTAVLSALLDSSFILIQRYNRPRLMRLAEMRRRHGK